MGRIPPELSTYYLDAQSYSFRNNLRPKYLLKLIDTTYAAQTAPELENTAVSKAQKSGAEDEIAKLSERSYCSSKRILASNGLVRRIANTSIHPQRDPVPHDHWGSARRSTNLDGEASREDTMQQSYGRGGD